MYIPAHFSVDEAGTASMLAAVTTGNLVTATDAGLLATFLPLVFDPAGGEHGRLLGHLARTNDQWRAEPRGESLVIADGPDAYVSPGWYASKAEHGRVVPTWNYATVHAYGTLTCHDDPEWIDAVVRRLTDRHEAGRDHPWSVDDAPAQFHAGQLRAIVGVEVTITRVEAKVKMSQNRPDADIDGVIAGLQSEGRDAGAALVERWRARRDSNPSPSDP